MCTVSVMEWREQDVGGALSFVGSWFELVDIFLGVCLRLTRKLPYSY